MLEPRASEGLFSVGGCSEPSPESFQWGALQFCCGAWHCKINQKCTCLSFFTFQFEGACSFVWGAKFTKAPRGDGTGAARGFFQNFSREEQKWWNLFFPTRKQPFVAATMLCRLEPPDWQVEPKTRGVTVTEFPTRLRRIYSCYHEFNVISGGSPRHTFCWTFQNPGASMPLLVLLSDAHG